MLVNHVYKGDCVKVMSQMADGSINVIFSDPPYNISGTGLEWEEKNFKKVNEEWDTMSEGAYLKFTKDWLTEAKRLLTPNGTIFVCASSHNLAEVKLEMKRLGFQEINLVVWSKTNAMRNMTRRTLTHSSEFIIWASKGPGYTFNYWESKAINPDLAKDGFIKQMGDVWTMSRCAGKERVVNAEGKSVHPTQKPERLVERALRIACKPGDTVLDPFMGVGTTLVVAKKLGLHSVGIEMNEDYVKYAEERISKSSEPAVVWTPRLKT